MSVRVSYVEEEDETGNQHGNVDVFRVELINCHDNMYHPGQYVEGNVILETRHTLVIRGVTLKFCGRADVYWTEKQRGKGTKCVDTVSFEAHEEYFNIRNSLAEPGAVQPGLTKFPFKFRLSPPLPENYEDRLCRIEYFLEARIKQDNNTVKDLVERKDIYVSNPIDLNRIILPDVTLPVKTQKTINLGRGCCSGPVLVGYLRLPRSGYSPGETMYIQADTENFESVPIRNVMFTLYQEREYVTKHKTHTARDTVSEINIEQRRQFRNIPLSIPKHQLFNVSSCKCFGIRHILEMKIIPVRRRTLTLSLDVVLGGVRLQQVTLQTPAHLRLQPNNELTRKRETASEFQSRISKPAPSKMLIRRVLEPLNNEIDEDNIARRRRRKDRDKKVYPEDVTDASDYVDVK